MVERRGSYIPSDIRNKKGSGKSEVDLGKRRTLLALFTGAVGGAAVARDETRGIMVDAVKLGWRALVRRFDEVGDNGGVEQKDGQKLEKKSEDESMKGYDDALAKEFAYFTQVEKELGGKFDYEKATLHALKSEKYHLWDKRMETLVIKDEELCQEIYYRELLNKDKEERGEFLKKITGICQEFNVPVSVALGVIMTESKAIHEVEKNKKGEVLDGPQGVMQISLNAENLVRRVFGDKVKDVTREDYWGNVTLGVGYLALMHNYYGEQWGMACKAYSSGIGVTDKLIMAQMPEEFHQELEKRMEDPKNQKDMTPWDWQRKEIKKFLKEGNTNIVKAYYFKDEGGWGWNDDRDKHSVQYPFFVFHTGRKAYGILNSPEEPPRVGQFFASQREKEECKNLREPNSGKVAKL